MTIDRTRPELPHPAFRVTSTYSVRPLFHPYWMATARPEDITALLPCNDGGLVLLIACTVHGDMLVLPPGYLTELNSGKELL